MQTHLQAHPKFRAIWSILPQFLLPEEWGWGSSGTAPALRGCSSQALAKLQRWLALTGAADSPRDEQRGLFGQALHPWVQGDDAPLGSVCWMGHLLLRERGMSLK